MAAWSVEDWHAQLEEVLALQSIYGDAFRVTHIPGHCPPATGQAPLASPDSDHGSDGGGSSGGSSGSSSHSAHSTRSASPEDLEQLLESLIGSQPPQPSAAGGPLTCEVVVAVELPAGQLQLVIDTHVQDACAGAAAAGDVAGAGAGAGAAGAAGDGAGAGNDCAGIGSPPAPGAPPQQQQGPAGNSGRVLLPFGQPVRHLPPVHVQLQLPPRYPSDAAHPPLLTLQAGWLSRQHEQQLQEQLGELWRQQGPAPLCFSLLEHIRAQALPELGITQQLILDAAPPLPLPPQQQQQQQQQQQPQQPQPQQDLNGSSAHSSSNGRFCRQADALAHNRRAAAAGGAGAGAAAHPVVRLSPSATPFTPSTVKPAAGAAAAAATGLAYIGGTNDNHRQGRQQEAGQRQGHQQQQQQQQAGQKHGWQQQEGQQQRQHQQKQKQQQGQERQKQQQQQQQQQQQTQSAGCVGDLSSSLKQQLQLGQERRRRGRPPQQPPQPPQPPAQPQQQSPPPPPQQQQQQEGGTAPAMPAGASPQQAAYLHSAEQLALQLLRYSAAREQRDFNATTHTCGICFEQVKGADCLRLPDCRHFYCRTCLCACAASQLDSGAVDNMRCPEPSCRSALPPYVVKQLLGHEQYERWEALLLARALDRMPDVVYCPRCDAACVEDADNCAQCGGCLYVFCTFCSDSWHPGTQCLDPHERLRVLERRRRATSAADRHRELDLVNQAMSLQYIQGATKSCPGCGMATIKNEGCNKMLCTNCRLPWCWKCLQLIEGYDHFQAGGTCNLFDQEEIDRWHALLWANERAAEVEAGHRAVLIGRHAAAGAGGGGHGHGHHGHGLGGAHLVRCPVCGQESLREGRNNLVRCWSCNSHFCVACRTWLRGRVGQHFIGRGACKQHGD